MACQVLFNHMQDEHDLILTESEMAEIIITVHANHGYYTLKHLVREMRDVQKKYFITKDDKVLIRSKNLEKEIDNLLSDKLF